MSTTNDWSPETIAWVAGIFEGEGTFAYRVYSGTGRKQVTLRVTMTDEDIIIKLHTLTGVGNLYGPYVSKILKLDGTPRKSSYVWTITIQADVIRLGDALYPWLGARRRAKFDEIKSYYLEGKTFATKANGKWKGPEGPRK